MTAIVISRNICPNIESKKVETGNFSLTSHITNTLIKVYLWTCFSAVHYCVTSVHWPLIPKMFKSFFSIIITRVHNPPEIWCISSITCKILFIYDKKKKTEKKYHHRKLPVSLHDHSWTEVFVLVPPITGTWCTAARTQNTLIHSVLKHPQITLSVYEIRKRVTNVTRAR